MEEKLETNSDDSSYNESSLHSDTSSDSESSFEKENSEDANNGVDDSTIYSKDESFRTSGSKIGNGIKNRRNVIHLTLPGRFSSSSFLALG